MDGMTLPSELERFAEEAVAAGRYRDLAEVVATGVSLLQRQEAQRAAFVRSLEEAEAEGEREGFLTVDDACRDLDSLIEELDRSEAWRLRPS